MLCAFSMLLLLLMELKEINVELSFDASIILSISPPPTNNKDPKMFNHQPVITDSFYLYCLA